MRRLRSASFVDVDGFVFWFMLLLIQPAVVLIVECCFHRELLLLLGWFLSDQSLPILVHLWVGTRTDSPQERFIGNESVVVLRVAALLDQDVNLLTFQLLTERQQDVFKLSKHLGAVLHLVVQLQALNEVLKVAGFLGLLDVAVDWVELFQLNELLSLLLGTAQFVNHLQGGVEVEAAEAVAEVEHVHAGLALKVVDVKSKLCTFDILAVQIVSHFVLGGLPLSSLTTIEGEDRTEVPC